MTKGVVMQNVGGNTKSMKLFFYLILWGFILIGCTESIENKNNDLVIDNLDHLDNNVNMDTFKLSEADKEFIDLYRTRRKMFDSYLQTNKIKLHTCPGCGYPTIEERGNYEICAVCNWEDDNQDDKDENENWGGPNKISLTENRVIIGKLLQENEKQLSGKINDNPKEVIEILNIHSKLMDRISKSIPMDADTSHQGWKDWKKAEAELLKELIKK